jgi:hypothetical protein
MMGHRTFDACNCMALEASLGNVRLSGEAVTHIGWWKMMRGSFSYPIV